MAAARAERSGNYRLHFRKMTVVDCLDTEVVELEQNFFLQAVCNKSLHLKQTEKHDINVHSI